jgi:hypothetical protein
MLITMTFIYPTIFLYLSYRDEPAVYYAFGALPIGQPNSALFFITMASLVGFAGVSRALTLIIERKSQIEMANIAIHLADPSARGKLESKYCERMNQIMAALEFSVPKLFTLLNISILIFIFIHIGEEYYNPKVPFTYKLLIGLLSYSPIGLMVFPVYICGFIGFFGSALYTISRFKQVSNKFNKCQSNAQLMEAMSEHNEICVINEKNNKLTRWILFEIYYAASVIIDLAILQAFYYTNQQMIRNLFMAITCFACFLSFLLAFMAALVKSAAHSPYKTLNSIIAKSNGMKLEKRRKTNNEILQQEETPLEITRVSLETIMKMNNLIERLAQTQITIWCLDLFPLNFYEFYLFVAAVASNLFLFINLIKA